MAKMDNIQPLFTSQGCISAEAVRRYMSGDLSEEQLDSLERHAAGCNLCRNALEGGLLFEDGRQFTSGLEKMQRKWNRTTDKEPLLSKAAIAGMMSVAASLILLIGLHFIIQHQRSQRTDYIASRIFGGQNISESIESDGLLLVALSTEGRARGSVREEEQRKYFLNSQEIRKSEPRYALLNEIHIYADKDIKDRSRDTGFAENSQKAGACLEYPLKAVAMIPPVIHTPVGSGEDMPGDYQAETQLDKESIDLFRNFVMKNVRYPLAAKEKRIGCKVYVQFAIDKKGSLIDPVILNSCHSLFDSELLRVLRETPLWHPGIQDGRPVEVALVMPVEFRPD